MAFRAKVVEEEETKRRVEEEVACRLEQELERRSEEIESEVERRVAAAKLEMEVEKVIGHFCEIEVKEQQSCFYYFLNAGGDAQGGGEYEMQAPARRD